MTYEEKPISSSLAHGLRASRPGRLGAQDRHAALAAPAEVDGFVSRTLAMSGQRLHTRQRQTDMTATPYVLLHGLAVSHRYLMPTARRLGPGSVYVPDPAAATAWGQAGRLLRDLPHEDWRQTPILAADIRDAGLRRILTTLRYAVTDDLDAKLPAIRVPTLLIRGSRDRIAPQPWLDRIAGRIPHASTLTIDRAAHNVVTTAGIETAAAVKSFIAPRDHVMATSDRAASQDR
jgi:pimeloyl-ACP methyl ester carboxylesterase